LTEANLIGKIKSTYREWLVTGNHGRKIDADYWSALLASRTLKIQVLDELESELKSELKSLDKRNVELARTLAVKKHTLN
jgi:hypothetical protein